VAKATYKSLGSKNTGSLTTPTGQWAAWGHGDAGRRPRDPVR